ARRTLPTERTGLAAPVGGSGMKCLRCHQDNPPHAKFCLECGTPFSGVTLVAGAPADVDQIEGLCRALTEAQKQQGAAADILRVISSSPTDVQPVFDAIVQHAGALCRGTHTIVVRLKGNVVTLVAHNAPSAEAREHVSQQFPWQLDPEN